MANQPVSLATQRVLEFLENEIQGFVVGDLTRLSRLAPSGTEPFTRLCTIPESMAVFLVMELMGFLMRADFNEEQLLDMPRLLAAQTACGEATGADAAALDVLGSRTRVDDTSGNIRYMMEDWLNLESGGQYDGLTIRLLISFFRHGSAHRFFPKAAGISKIGASQPVLVIRQLSGFPVPLLNEDRLREDYLGANRRITSIVSNMDDAQLQQITGELVSSLVLRMNSRLDALLYLDRRKLKNILRAEGRTDLLPNQISSTSVVPVTSTVQYNSGLPQTTSGGDYLKRSI